MLLLQLHRASLLAILVLTTGLTALLPASAAVAANNLIVVNKSVDGIRLRASSAAVKHRLGKPTRIFRRTVPATSLRGATRYQTWQYERRKLTVTLDAVVPSTSFRVTMFEIRGTTEHTSNGLRVGSTLADVQKKLSDATCQPGFAGSTQCLVRGGGIGPVGSREFTTQVSVENGKARSIVLSYLQTWNDPPPS